jgi:hypothetical protein
MLDLSSSSLLRHSGAKPSNSNSYPSSLLNDSTIRKFDSGSLKLVRARADLISYSVSFNSFDGGGLGKFSCLIGYGSFSRFGLEIGGRLPINCSYGCILVSMLGRFECLVSY